MKKKEIFVLVMACLFLSCPCLGQSELVVKYGEKYICGDSFELTIPNQPATTTMVSRTPLNLGYRKITDVHSQAEDGEILLPVRIVLRNLTPLVYQGLKPESFQLTGYVRDRKQVYYPEIMEPYDYGDYEETLYRIDGQPTYDHTTTLYSELYNKYALFLPLRELDILLVYRVNPILINWDLTVNPQATYGTTSQYGEQTYDPIPDQDPCNVVLLFPSIQNGVTHQVIEYERAE